MNEREIVPVTRTRFPFSDGMIGVLLSMVASIFEQDSARCCERYFVFKIAELCPSSLED
jgi:hypothetical protein